MTKAKDLRSLQAAPARRRLAPEVRKDLILDEAARIVIEEGVSAVSMEGLGRAAGVSKALVYNYFPNRLDLLSALLRREYGLIQERGTREVEASETFEDLIRRTTRVYLEHVAERGVIIQRLLNEPQVAEAMRQINDEGRAANVRFFARAITQHTGIAPDIALAATDIAMGLTGAGGDYMYRTNATVDFVEDLCVTLVLGGIDRLAADEPYGKGSPARKDRRSRKA